MNLFFENLRLVPETRVPKEHFKLVFGSGTSDLVSLFFIVFEWALEVRKLLKRKADS